MTEYIVFRLRLDNAQKLLDAYDKIAHAEPLLERYFSEIRAIVNERKKMPHLQIPTIDGIESE